MIHYNQSSNNAEPACAYLQCKTFVFSLSNGMNINLNRIIWYITLIGKAINAHIYSVFFDGGDFV